MRNLLIGCLLACSLVTGISGQEPTKKDEPSYLFEMRGKTWGTVFEWLADKTGRTFVSRDIPTGTLNFIAPKDHKFTIPQIIDIINDGLYPLNFVLIDKGTSFALFPSDKEIPDGLLPRLTPDELSKHGQTEIVSTIVKLKAQTAEEIAPEVKKQLSPFGKVVPLTSTNQLLIQDRVVNVQRVVAALQQATINIELVPLSVLDAPRTVESLKAVFSSQKGNAPYFEADAGRNSILVKGTADQVADAKIAIRALGEDKGGSNLRIIPLERGGAAVLAETLQRLLQQARPDTPVQIYVPGGKKN
jgi:hypothetical protein